MNIFMLIVMVLALMVTSTISWGWVFIIPIFLALYWVNTTEDEE
jgi:hypothetical protein